MSKVYFRENRAINWLKSHGTEQMRIRLARQTTNQKILLALAQDNSLEVQSAVFENPRAQFSYVILAKLEKYFKSSVEKLPHINKLILTAQNTISLQELYGFATHLLYCVRDAAFSNPKILELARTSTSPEILRNLAENAIGKLRVEVEMEVSKNQFTPVDAFEVLANSCFSNVQEATMESPYAPPGIVAKLINKHIEKKPYGGSWEPGPTVWVDDSCKDYQMPDVFYPAGYKYAGEDIERVRIILASHSKSKGPILVILKDLNCELYSLLL